MVETKQATSAVSPIETGRLPGILKAGRAASAIVALCISLVPVKVFGQPALPASAPAAAAAPNDHNNYEGDRLVFPLRLVAVYEDGHATPVCVPSDTALRGLGAVENDNAVRFRVIDDGKRDCLTNQPLKTDVAIVVNNWDVTSRHNPPDRYGLTYGALLVPFKLQLTGNKDVVGGSSVGGYIGRRFAKSSVGAELSLNAFVGGTTLPISHTVNGQNTTQNIAGTSIGLGILGTIKDEFHLGAVIGADHVGSGVGYEYNNKPWVALEFGYDFSQ